MIGALRSLLFAPGNDQHKLEKALNSGADAVVADLEDSVPAPEKPRAREIVASVLSAAPHGPLLIVRVNEAASHLIADDLELTEKLPLAAIVVPKASPTALNSLTERQSHPIVAVIEMALGIRAAYEIARCPGVEALAFGAVDLAAECGLSPLPGGRELLFPRASLVFDSAAAGIGAPLDTPYLQIRDLGGFVADAKLARGLGFRGKVCVHPDQVDSANEVFSQSDERAWAERALAMHARAAVDGRGAVEVSGEMIDMASVRRAERILAHSEDRRAHDG